MSTTTLEIPEQQIERLEALAQRAQMPVAAIFELMLDLVSLGVEASVSNTGNVATVSSMLDALRQLKPDTDATEPVSNFPLDLAEDIHRRAAATATERSTPEWIAAEAVRAKARRDSVGFNLMSGQPKVDGVEYQNDMRDAW